MTAVLPPQPAKILLVEDDNLLLEALCKTLEAAGYETDIATNGNEALEMAGRMAYNAVVLDLIIRNKYVPVLSATPAYSRLLTRHACMQRRWVLSRQALFFTKNIYRERRS
jgi:CheY-like chemotaxis protein